MAGIAYTRKNKSFFSKEFLSDIDKQNEFIMTQLRRSAGVNIETFKANFGIEATQKFLNNALKIKYLVIDEKRIYISENNFLISDMIIAQLFECN